MDKTHHSEDKKPNKLLQIYDQQYKKMLLIPFIMLILAISILGFKYLNEGSFIDKDVSLKGGITITIPTTEDININQLNDHLSQKFTNNDLEVRSLKSSGRFIGVIVNADLDGTNQQLINSLISSIESSTGLTLNKNDYSLEFIGGTLGASFLKEITRALIIAFIFMAIVVFIYFRSFIPSIAVVMAALSDIIVTLSIVSLLNIKLSTAGIAAFLMLIGYSVDTDILLSNKVLKNKQGSVLDRVLIAMKTGLMMTFTTMMVIIVALIFTQSEVIKQIMLILLIGLLVDLINTWIQNVGILRFYMDKKLKGKNE